MPGAAGLSTPLEPLPQPASARSSLLVVRLRRATWMSAQQQPGARPQAPRGPFPTCRATRTLRAQARGRRGSQISRGRRRPDPRSSRAAPGVASRRRSSSWGRAALGRSSPTLDLGSGGWPARGSHCSASLDRRRRRKNDIGGERNRRKMKTILTPSQWDAPRPRFFLG